MRKTFPIPARDPVGGGPLYISELTSEDGSLTLRGAFEVPRYARLDPDQARFLETFLRCRGMLSAVEKELNLSYPTVRGRLDSLLEALDLAQTREDKPAVEPPRQGAAVKPTAHVKSSNGSTTKRAEAEAEPASVQEPFMESKQETQSGEEPFGRAASDEVKPMTIAERRQLILGQLERGEISADEAKAQLGARK